MISAVNVTPPLYSAIAGKKAGPCQPQARLHQARAAGPPQPTPRPSQPTKQNAMRPITTKQHTMTCPNMQPLLQKAVITTIANQSESAHAATTYNSTATTKLRK